MTTPTIHMNGTSASALCESYTEAMRAVSAAIEAAGNASPNARDYYPQGDEANRTARAEHTARIEKLEAVRVEFEALAMHCIDHDPKNRRS